MISSILGHDTSRRCVSSWCTLVACSVFLVSSSEISSSVYPQIFFRLQLVSLSGLICRLSAVHILHPLQTIFGLITDGEYIQLGSLYLHRGCAFKTSFQRFVCAPFIPQQCPNFFTSIGENRYNTSLLYKTVFYYRVFFIS